MTDSEQTASLVRGIQKQVEYHRTEYNMTLATFVGCLEIVKAGLIQDVMNELKNEEEGEDGDE